MDKSGLDEILACLPRERTLFRYYQGYYAPLLLGYAAREGARIDTLRHSPFGRLLARPELRPLLAVCGDGWIDRVRLESLWREPSYSFLLTLGRWGGDDRRWQQRSRAGWNLVLRLNFNHGHDRQYRRLVAPKYQDTFGYYAHPVMRHNERPYFRETLAWARLDVDLDAGEALIEEVQSDWVRIAAFTRRRLEHWTSRCGRRFSMYGSDASPEDVRRYLDEVFEPYGRVWAEAMLSAALRFIREELGIPRIWYHTWETGCLLKGIGKQARPPRSLYSNLPRLFCFNETDAVPCMLDSRWTARKLRRSRIEPRFFLLELT